MNSNKLRAYAIMALLLSACRRVFSVQCVVKSNLCSLIFDSNWSKQKHDFQL